MHKPSTEQRGLPSFFTPPGQDTARRKQDRRRWTLSTSFGHAVSGLWYAIRTQPNMRIHLSVSVAVLILGLYVGLNWVQWAVLALTIGAVLIAELFNTVAEAALDAAAPDYHPLVKVAKDVAAGAVLLTALVSVLVGVLILGPPLYAKIATWLEFGL
jgi:undecaprenol kinase/diacylglycerol kinase (ATP)